MVRIVLLLVLFDAAVGWRALDMPMVAIIPTYFSRWARAPTLSYSYALPAGMKS